ncbi:MAG: acyltransferase family protein [Myxococcales bacterium]|nr:acyltransferase family protein [Myxococcales bacterium]
MARLPGMIARRVLEERELRRLSRMRLRDTGHGYDPLGLSPDWVAMASGLFRPLYERYFRVVSQGAENIPAEGAAILAANHSGMLPIDGVMIYMDVLRKTHPPRVLRVVGDLFIPRLPFISTFFARTGVVAGSRGNFRHLLVEGELLLVFPEGTPGIGKGYRRRYELQRFRVGHAELAIRHRVPVVPVAVIGAEEVLMQIARVEAKLFGIPYLPIPLLPFPLPARIHLRYGEPMHLYEGTKPEDADDPVLLEAAAARVKEAVGALLEQGLAEREGVFK